MLDDLHAADLPSLLFLLFLSRQIATAPLFILGTSREVEPRLTAEIADALAKIGREGEVVSLPRLTRDDVTAWVGRSGGPDHDGADVFRVSEGNPLFVRELLRMSGRDTKRARTLTSDGMKAALDERLEQACDRRPHPARSRSRRRARFRITRARRSHRQRSRHGPRALTTRRRRRGRRDGHAGAIPFHARLLRDRLYETYRRRKQSALHWMVGLSPRRTAPIRTTVANHLLEGAGAGDRERAAASALRAADQALARLAFEAAAAIADRGTAVLGAGPSRLACKLR